VQRVYESGDTETGQLFVALEWVEGATLSEVLDAGGALAAPTALRVAIRVGEALEALHHNGLVHGRLGPDSVVMVKDGERIRLVGAELAAAYRTPVGRRVHDPFPLSYPAPEQVERGEATEKTDVYALGMLLRQLLTAAKGDQTAGAVAATPPLSSTIQRIIATALEPRPERRYPDISVMVNDIWGATAVLAEPESRPRSVKARGNPRRRVRRRRPPFPLRITAAVVTAGIVAALVWVAGFDGFDRIVARFQSRVTPPAVTAVPIDRDAAPASESPAPESVAREQTSTPEPRAVAPTSTVPFETPVITGKPAPPVYSRAGTDRSPSLLERRAVTDGSTPFPEPRAITERPATQPEPRTVTEKPAPERRAPTVARPAATPTTVRPAPAVSGAQPRPAIEGRPTVESPAPAPVERRAPAERPAQAERSGTEPGDGSAVIDWLLKDRR
jgi:serine/threonine protein kinase